MATRPKAVIESRNGEKFSPITIAKNVLTDDGQNLHDILSDRKEDMMTPTIENSSSMFKVGQGDNVDYSSNVVNGAYESTVLKGKTMVNCIQKPSSQDVVLPYAFEDGQYVTINDTKESGALGVELKGQTLVNLISDITQIKSTATVELIEYSLSPMSFVAKYGNTVSNTSNNRIVIHTPFKERLKLNEDYTIVYDYELLENPDNVDCQIAIAVDMWGQMAESPVIQTKGSKGRVVHRQNRASNNISTTFNFINNQGTNAKWKISNLMLLEGDWTNKEIPPYFEGMASCKMPILHTVGKNLLNDNTSVSGWIMEDGRTTIRGALGSGSDYLSDFIYVGNINQIKINRGCYVTTFDENKKIISQFVNVDNANVSNCSYIRIAVSCNAQVALGLVGTMQVEEGSVATSYEPHKSSILSTPSDLILRGIGNVQDTLNLTTGEYTQAVYEYTFTGDEAWEIHGGNNGGYSYFNCYDNQLPVNFDYGNRANVPIMCDRLPLITYKDLDDGLKSVGINLTYSVRLNFSDCNSNNGATVKDLKAYLKANPTTIQYPIKKSIKTVDLNVVDQNGSVIPTLKSWNTTTHIHSEIPENSLYPILSHSNPTYPVILKPSTKYSIVANSYSNSHTNSAIKFNLGGATASTTVGNRVTTVTTPSTLSNELLTMSGRGNKLNNVMVIEGDVVGDEPYFEGICDSKSPILSNVGKNLFDERKVILNKYQNHNTSNGEFSISTNTNYKITDFIRVKPNTKYDNQIGNGAYYNIDKKPLTNHFCGISIITTPSDAHYVVLNMGINEDTSTGYFIEAPQRVTHEPHESNTTTFNQKDGKTIVLRSLPNGVCDTLNVETGEYVQRIGEIVLDGSYIAYSNQSSGGYPSATSTAVLLNLKSSEPPQNRMTEFVCKDLPHYPAGDSIWMNDTPIDTGISGVSGAWDFCIRLPYAVTGGTSTDSNDVVKQKFKEYLNANPVTVQYELATPIVTTIDIQGFPYAYTNGHVQLSSGSIEQSLTPKVEYSVVTNRNGQIRSNQKMVERHQKQLDRLQAMILTNLVNTQYEQTLTNLKYDLKNVREEVK